MREMKADEVKTVMMGIASEFHRLCVENGLKYYMAYGTMLGAIRHKGFIPWDDDMDFVMPKEDYDKLLSIAAGKLGEPYRLVTYRNSSYPIAYAKIEDTRTEIVETRLYHSAASRIGVNIDIFPINECSSDIKKVNHLLRKIHSIRRIIAEVYNEMPEKFVRRALRYVLRFFYQNDKSRCKWVERQLRVFESFSATGNDAYAHCGAYRSIDVVNKSIYGEPKLYDFETIQLYGVENFDDYLRSQYGEYMELPPVEKREIHSEGYFFKE